MSLLQDYQYNKIFEWLQYAQPVLKRSNLSEDVEGINKPVFIRKRRTRTSLSPAKESTGTSLAISQGDGGFDDNNPHRGRSATLPRMRSLGQIDSSSFRRHPSLKTWGTETNAGLSKSVDRFLPTRHLTLQPSIQSFHANKDPCSLSTDEKLHRHPEVSIDSFNPRPRAVSSPSSSRSQSRRRNFSGNRSGGGAGASILSFLRDPPGPDGNRQVSVGTIWSVGGLAPVSGGISNGRGRLLASGTNARLYTTPFSASHKKTRQALEADRYENRLAEALRLDRVSRVFEFRDPSTAPVKPTSGFDFRTEWNGTEWVLAGPEHTTKGENKFRELPSAPFKVLDAPNLRDDFYCSVLAYSATCHTLAVGLGSLLYGWSESGGVRLLNSGAGNGSWLTSIAFSSPQGCRSILCFGRSDGSINLISLYDSLLPRFEVQQPCPIACVAWRPCVTVRASRNPSNPGVLVKTEDLLVGDESGNIYYYSVEWPDVWEVHRDGWSGCVTLLVRLSTHTQQICGISFSRNGSIFATGGNDNLCCLFDTKQVLEGPSVDFEERESYVVGADGIRRISIPSGGQIKEVKAGSERHRWIHGAAVKAIAFCPWRDGLVATGGGSNDKCIHFYHALSGASLATISVAAQVTSLIWSTTRREICATFGYAQPEHPFRVAIFSWPECQQVAAIAWEGEHRALFAIAYPGGPNESQTSKEGGCGLSRTAKEGCIVVASSDESVKFHEVWTANPKATAGGVGSLGGSDILEGLEGIDKEGDIIR